MRRVVVTGLGLLTSIGNNVGDSWNNLISCKSGIKKIKNFDVVPHPDQLDDLWFYVNIRLNFARLFREERTIKLKQQLRFLRHVSTKTAPDNALVMYFFAFLQWKVKIKAF